MFVLLNRLKVNLKNNFFDVNVWSVIHESREFQPSWYCTWRRCWTIRTTNRRWSTTVSYFCRISCRCSVPYWQTLTGVNTSECRTTIYYCANETPVHRNAPFSLLFTVFTVSEPWYGCRRCTQWAISSSPELRWHQISRCTPKGNVIERPDDIIVWFWRDTWRLGEGSPNTCFSKRFIYVHCFFARFE